MTPRGHRQIEHTADLALELWAPSEAGLWHEAGIALVAIITDDARLIGDTRRPVHLGTVDREDRLVQWMNEVIYWATIHGFLFTHGELGVDGDALVGTVYGVSNARDRLTAELKSATYHDLSVAVVDGQWRARVVVDV